MGMGRGVVMGLAVGCAVATCVVAAVLVGRRVKTKRKWGKVVRAMKDFEEGCLTPIGRLRQIVDAMAVEMHAGLASDGGSKLKMLLTYVDSLPDGNENGIFYGLDLGSTDFRVSRVHLGGRNILEHEVECHSVPQHLSTCTTKDLFDFIAVTLKQFVEKEGSESENMPDKNRKLGFTFSFPLRQTSISSGTLLKWTKGFAIEDTVDKDVSECLEEAMTKIGLHMQVAALVNDTVGTLALCHYYDEDTVAAVIIGTGTNACYVERTDAIIKSQGLFTNSGGMVINLEWGSFWSSHLPRTSYDVTLDEDSPSRNDQGFEKMVSSMYLGDIIRRVISAMAEESDLFGGDVAQNLSQPFILRMPLIVAMHEDDSADLAEVARILIESFQVSKVPLKTRRLVVRLCDVVTRRAARLVAAGIVGILKKVGRDGSSGISGGRTKNIKTKRTVIAIEGDLYSEYTMFREYLNEAVTDILGDDIAENIILKEFDYESSGIGSALLAAASHSSHQAFDI